MLLLVLANRELNQQRLPFGTAAVLTLGLLLWTATTVVSSARASPPSPVMTSRAPRLPLFLFALAMTTAAWLTSGAGVYTATNLAFWLGAVAAWLLAWWPEARRVRRPSLSRSDAVTLLALGAVVGLAAFFCFHALGSVPGEPTSDHAENMLDIQDVLRGQHPIFFARNTGREPAVFYVTAALIRWFGQPFSWETLKLGTALVGLLAVPAIFLLGRELAGPVVGLAAAALAAVAKWPLGDERFGLRLPYAILASALTLWLLFRYLRRSDRRDALLCGLALAFGLHGYSPFRVLLLAAVVVFTISAFRLRQTTAWRVPLIDAVLAYATAVVASVPLIHYTVQHPDLVLMRQSSRLEGAQGIGGTLSTFVDNTRNALLAFNWRGGSGWTVTIVDQPFLDWMTGALLLAGAVVVVTILVSRRSIPMLAVVALTPVLLLASTLSFAFPHENPSANRMGVAVPLVFSVAALPVGILWGAASAIAVPLRGSLRHVLVPVTATLLIVLVCVVSASNYTSYFRDYRRQYRLSAVNTSEVATALKAEGVPLHGMFLVGYPNWLDGRNLALALGDFDWYLGHQIFPGMPIPPPPSRGRAVYALHADDRASRRELARRFPEGAYIVVRSAVPGKGFALYVVPRS